MNKIRILAVDDNKSLIEMIKEYFKKEKGESLDSP